MKTIKFGMLAATMLLAPIGGCDTQDDDLEGDRVAELDQEQYHIDVEDAEAEGATRHDAADALALDAPVSAAGNFFEPVGTLDRADCSKIAGWVKDGDTTLPTWASIRTAPWPFGSQVATPLANLYRPGLPFADKNHGFDINTPAWLKDGQTHTIYVHGINVDANGNWDVNANSPLLNLSGRSFCCGTGCFGGPEIPEGP